jgi:integrase
MADTQEEKRNRKRTRGVYEKKKGSGVWWICYFDEHGRRHREMVGTKALARDAYQKRKNEVRERRYFPKAKQAPTLRQAFDYYLANRKEAGSVVDMTRNVRVWREHLGANTRLDEVEPKHIRQFIAARCQTGLSESSINRELATLRAVYNEQIEDELYRGANPVLAKFSTREDENARTRYLSNNEAPKLLLALPSELDRVIVTLAPLIGFRRGNLFKLRWEHVDFDAGVIWARKTKSGKPYPVPMSDEVRKILEGLPKTSEWVFPSENPSMPLDADNWYRRVFQPACARAGIADFHFHDLRHTFGTRLAEAGTHLAVIQALMGHADPRTTARYTHATDEAKRAAVAALGTATRSATAPLPATRKATK